MSNFKFVTRLITEKASIRVPWSNLTKGNLELEKCLQNLLF